MDINEALSHGESPDPIRRPKDEPQFSMEWDGTSGFIQTGPLPERPTTWDDLIRDSLPDVDLAEIEVIEPVVVKGWDISLAKRDEEGRRYTVVERAHGYRLNLRRRRLPVDIAELLALAKGARASTATPVRDQGYILALGDLQLGKMDGDGPKGTTARFLEKTEAAVERYRRVAKGRPVFLFHLGDCIEGFMSQGGANAWRTVLTTTEQVRLYRTLLLEQVKMFARVAPELTVAGVPGNHDEAARPLQTYGDSWAIDAMLAVADTCREVKALRDVKFYVPKRDELTLAIDVCGTAVGLAHGHQFRPGKGAEWWAKQSHGRQPVGTTDLLLTGHFHHLRIEQTGSDKTWMQLPALESGSQWWKHRTGEWGQPGVVSMLAGDGAWSAMEVL